MRSRRSSIGTWQWIVVGACYIAAAICLGNHIARERATELQSNEVVNALVDHIARAKRVAVAVFDADGSANERNTDLLSIIDSVPTMRCDLIDGTDIRSGKLKQYDVIVFPGGSGRQQSAALNGAGRCAVRNFVHNGGGYVGICAGAFLATAEYDWGLALVNAKTMTGLTYVVGVGQVSMAARKSGTVQMELTKWGKRVFPDGPEMTPVMFAGGPIMSEYSRRQLPRYTCLAVYRTEVYDHECQIGTMIDSPAIIASRFGRGHVIAIGAHPELTAGLQSFTVQAICAAASPD